MKEATHVTLIWFVIWLIWNFVGDRESLTFAPVNFWAGALILAVALDLGRQHTRDLAR
jgi:hypothetical protein